METVGNALDQKTVVNTLGQVCMDLILHPPTLADCSEETVVSYSREKDELLASLKRRARIITDALNAMDNVKSQEIEGALYAFPRIYLPEKAIEFANQRNQHPDLFYCYEGTQLF